MGCRFCFARHVVAHDLFDTDVPFFIYFYPACAISPPPLPLPRVHCLSCLVIIVLLRLKLFQLLMRVKRLMTKNSVKRGTAVGGSVSTISKGDLKKANFAGFIPDSMEYALPDDEVVPRPAKGFRVMFLALLYRDLSLPSHEFLHGLLFVYDVHPHQLTPNSILHIACFIMLCEAFIGIRCKK
jgi:hypothetical protein